MKKIYAIALAAAVAANASAALNLSARADLVSTVKKERIKKCAPDKSVSRFAANAGLLKAAAGKNVKSDAGAFDVEGIYVGSFGDYYFSNSVGLVEQDCQAEITDGYLVINSEWFLTNLVCPYDASTHSISMKSLDLGPISLDNGNTYYYARIEPFEYDWSLNGGEGDIVARDYTVTFDPVTGKIEFPDDHGVSWVVYADDSYSVWAGYLDAFDIVSLQRVDEELDPDYGWTSMGNATFMDGWLLPAAGIDQKDPSNWYEVELQQSDFDNNVYRLVDPYKGNCPLASENASTKRGYIQFDVTDPDHVTFAKVDAGFVNAELNFTQMYCLNVLSFLSGAYSMDVQTIISIMSEEMPYTTFRNGVVSLEAKLNDDGVLENDAVFGDQDDAFGGYEWKDGEGNSADMTTKIFFPGANESGVSNVAADASACNSVRYYNLQGQPVAAPAAGTMVIRMTGDRTEKIVVR